MYLSQKTNQYFPQNNVQGKKLQGTFQIQLGEVIITTTHLKSTWLLNSHELFRRCPHREASWCFHRKSNNEYFISVVWKSGRHDLHLNMIGYFSYKGVLPVFWLCFGKLVGWHIVNDQFFPFSIKNTLGYHFHIECLIFRMGYQC